MVVIDLLVCENKSEVQIQSKLLIQSTYEVNKIFDSLLFPKLFR